MSFITEVTTPSLNIESYVAGPLKIWHIAGMVAIFGLCIVIVICCCMEVRIPRSKQQIEEGLKRKHALVNHRNKREKQLNSASLTRRSCRRTTICNNNNSSKGSMFIQGEENGTERQQRERTPDYNHRIQNQLSTRNTSTQNNNNRHKNKRISESVPLANNPSRWASAMAKMGSQQTPIRQQENLMKSLASLRPVNVR